jgi:hypothetical protein
MSWPSNRWSMSTRTSCWKRIEQARAIEQNRAWKYLLKSPSAR